MKAWRLGGVEEGDALYEGGIILEPYEAESTDGLIRCDVGTEGPNPEVRWLTPRAVESLLILFGDTATWIPDEEAT